MIALRGGQPGVVGAEQGVAVVARRQRCGQAGASFGQARRGLGKAPLGDQGCQGLEADGAHTQRLPEFPGLRQGEVQVGQRLVQLAVEVLHLRQVAQLDGAGIRRGLQRSVNVQRQLVGLHGLEGPADVGVLLRQNGDGGRATF